MLYALGNPLALVVLVLSFVAAIILQGVAQALVAARLGQRGPAQEGRLRSDPRRHLDAFGAIAAGLAGTGWGRPISLGPRTGRARLAAIQLAGPLALVAGGVALLVAAGAADPAYRLGPGELSAAIHGGFRFTSPLPATLLTAGAVMLGVGLLGLVPIPPLPGGAVLFAYAPRGGGWARARYYLQEQHWGVGALLLLLLLPLAGRAPLLLVVVEALASLLLGLLPGAVSA